MVNQSQHLSPQSSSKDRISFVMKNINEKQIGQALKNMILMDIDAEDADSFALAHAQILLKKALFGSAMDWQQAREEIIKHTEAYRAYI